MNVLDFIYEKKLVAISRGVYGDDLLKASQIINEEGFITNKPLSLAIARQLPYRGEPLAKRRNFALCQSLPSIGEVALRSNDGEVEPIKTSAAPGWNCRNSRPRWGSCA